MEMNYKRMVEHARQTGTTNEKTMWESIESFSELLEELEESHPDLYWEFMRKQHGIMHHLVVPAGNLRPAVACSICSAVQCAPVRFSPVFPV